MARESKKRRDERRFGRLERISDCMASFQLQPWVDLRSDPKEQERWLELVRTHTDVLGRAKIIDAQNVQEHIEREHKGKRVRFGDLIPNHMPPFPVLFIEFCSDESIRHGFLISSIPADEVPLPESYADLRGEDATRFVSASIYLKHKDTDFASGPYGTTFFFINDKGELSGSMGTHIHHSFVANEDHCRELAEYLQTGFLTAFMTISFMHCKNVPITCVEPNKLVNRQRSKAGLTPFLRYHTINIDPMRATGRDGSDANGDGFQKALHICRGHFSTYTEERPLFGKVSGTFWVPSHVRGSAKNGVVISDYNVKSPKS
jgi:hypothetical protein